MGLSFYMKNKNGDMVHVPADKLDDWLKAQEEDKKEEKDSK